MAQKTRNRARIAFWRVSLILFSILGVKYPNPQFLGREQAFSSQTCKISKVSYYRNYCIDFNQFLHKDRDHQLLVAGGPNIAPNKSKMADGRHFQKTYNRHTSATV